MQAAIAGFGLGFSLILAIGAQNAFVLRHGVMRAHVFPICLTCALSDAILIVAGVAGFGALTQAVPGLEWAMRLFGAAFLIWYGTRSAISAWRGGSVMETSGDVVSLKRALLTCLALTWLNPHVYLDTVVLLGSVSSQWDNRVGFAIGAVISSFVFFFGLGYGARFLSPLFARAGAWRLFEAGIAIVMWAIAAKLLLG